MRTVSISPSGPATFSSAGFWSSARVGSRATSSTRAAARPRRVHVIGNPPVGASVTEDREVSVGPAPAALRAPQVGANGRAPELREQPCQPVQDPTRLVADVAFGDRGARRLHGPAVQ